jgi:hypothetical protein
VYPAAYRTMLRAGAPRLLREAAERVCPYRREALRAAFEAGWYAYTVRQRLGDGFTAPHLSKLARVAWLRGHQAREMFEGQTKQEVTQ